MIIKDIHAVFGNELPASRSAYSAHTVKPHTMLAILKQYKTWTAFVLEYNKFSIQERNKAVVTNKVTKNVVKESK